MSADGASPVTDNAVQTFPALFSLYRTGLLPKDIKIVGYARTKMDQEEYYKRVTSYIKNPNNDQEIAAKIQDFKNLSSYVPGDYEDGAAFDKLNSHLAEIESHYQSKETHRIFYLALPPSVFIPVAKNLKQHCYVIRSGINRIIVEKPFGKDLLSSRQLLGSLKQYWNEDETFRIDHYLGKEMVKNLLVLRFANIAMAAAWDKNYVSNVQITFKEPFGTEGRGGYFDEFGIIRDILQNRECTTAQTKPTKRGGLTFNTVDLLQVLSILTMERPVSFAAEDIRDEKVRFLYFFLSRHHGNAFTFRSKSCAPSRLSSVKTPSLASMSPRMVSQATLTTIQSRRTLYVPLSPLRHCGSTIRDGRVFPSSSKPEKVCSHQPLIRLKVFSNLPPPSALNEAKVEIRIQFKDVTQGIFKDISRNELVLRIQPSEALYLKMNAKDPGMSMRAIPTEMDLTYKRRFSEAKIPEAYESLILDSLKGDHSNFVRDDELDVAWKVRPVVYIITQVGRELMSLGGGHRFLRLSCTG